MKKIILITILISISYFSFSQLKVLSTGYTQIGGGQVSNSAVLNLYSSSVSTIYSKVEHPFGWGDAIKSQVNRTDGIAFSAWYNGTRKFMVFGNGDVWSATGIYTSDSTLKHNIENVKNPIQVLKNLHGVTYLMKDDDRETKKKHIGLLAQEVEQVLPNIVYETDKGIKGIAYVELIPYLIEAIKEQQQTIEEQDKRIESIEADCCNKAEGLKSASLDEGGGLDLDGDVAKLYQNSPNPFKTETTIRFEIPQSVNSARLYICNMAGTLLKSIVINQRGPSNVIINANEFNAGMYLYSLVNDGKIIDTKQMLLTE